MTDNITVTPGSGSTVAADDVGGVLYQRVKISVGADGSATDLAPGGATASASIPVTIATDDPLQAKLGIVTETAPASDTASAGLNGRLQRIAQNLTTMTGRAVAALGARTVAQSPAVNIATDDAILGATNETAPASDTATAGHNGRLQRIAQRITSMIALLPAALGQGTMAQSMRVVLPSDQSTLLVAGSIVVATASFARPADTIAYAIGDIILDATSAATVNANVTAGTAGIMRLLVGRAADKTGMVRRLRLKTNDTAFAGATIRVHLYKDRPTVNTTGDNGAFSTTESNYIGYSDITLDRHFSDAEKGIGIPQIGSEWNFEPSSGTDYIHAILETRSAVTPGSAKTWTLAAEAHQN